MSSTYRMLSGFYDLIDVLYFTKSGTNPREAIIEAVPDSPVSILDMCAGTAANSLSIAKNRSQAKIVGIDISSDMLEIAEGKIQKGNFEQIVLLQADATSTPFEKNSFDIVVLSLVLHEADSGLAKRILKEAYRVLKSTGFLLVLEWEQPEEVIKKIKFFLIKLLEPKPFKKFISCNKRDYFHEQGFKIIEEKHCDYSCLYKCIKF